ncbi:hypothetical protein GGI25_003884 [Coemansia spiralis]|uniref:aminodeoxychorismate synthase n=2 Tax=Coemansia TaxID=4863 RepID=A0A9W8KXL9_9FUNG|nr:ADC synthase [Coemansia spiralis]KAJ1991069.1 hypothetical protein EDC05_003670 [Coemansia umbellata]KAJ2621118.1 hypothetical protein GGI26_004381 [Coemansia sp. RSA 1358]KAJ2675686.1 hypothetical protein GGI25_003884 [Coemansia spiralis]
MPSINSTRVLLVDNYDSYTFNLVQLLREHTQVVVIRNDYPWLLVKDTILPSIDSIVISPGPGTPTNKADFGICGQLIEYARDSGTPLLGVCLGHQGIAVHFGARVEECIPVHGQLSEIQIEGEPWGIFENTPKVFRVVRYHSLAVSYEGFPHDELQVVASTRGTVRSTQGDVEAQTIMAVAHRRYPIFGVQFHPESVASQHGREIVCSFVRMGRTGVLPESVRSLSITACRKKKDAIESATGGFRLAAETVDLDLSTDDTRELHELLYRDDPMPVWLDTTGGVSVLASAATPGSLTVRYSVTRRQATVWRLFGNTLVDTVDLKESFFDWMQRAVDQTQTQTQTQTTGRVPGFRCGWLGYFAYEMKQESCPGYTGGALNNVPDAQLSFIDRCVVIGGGRVEVLAIAGAGWSYRLGFDTDKSAQEWVAHTASRIRRWDRRKRSAQPAVDSLKFEPAIPHSDYLKLVSSAQAEIRHGESYEVCLTTQFTTKVTPTGKWLRQTYHTMRKRNPAPYSAMLWFPDIQLGILSLSPECFLRTTETTQVVEMRPIKGTRPTSKNPAENERLKTDLRTSTKDRAENLMIVDLIRHDLHQISRSVSVPQLMNIETHPFVHQMVTTVRAQLDPGVGNVDALRACFPPGSMTGAPKRRTLEILDRLEPTARGVYSGCLGYFSTSGHMDWCVVIRTMVVHQSTASVGAGGALTILSDPHDEWAEVLAKLNSIVY